MTPVLAEFSDSTQPSAPQVPGTTAASSEQLRNVPLTMPSEQEYYWHFEWQSGERESLVEIREGRGIRFDSDDPEDVARWLDEPDDE